MSFQSQEENALRIDDLSRLTKILQPQGGAGTSHSLFVNVAIWQQFGGESITSQEVMHRQIWKQKQKPKFNTRDQSQKRDVRFQKQTRDLEGKKHLKKGKLEI